MQDLNNIYREIEIDLGKKVQRKMKRTTYDCVKVLDVDSVHLLLLYDALGFAMGRSIIFNEEPEVKEEKITGLDVNLEYGDLENGNLESRTQKWDHSIPNNYAPTYCHTPNNNPNPSILSTHTPQQYSRSFKINSRKPYSRLMTFTKITC